MNEYVKRLFKNNGVARGWLYIAIAFFTSIASDLVLLAHWIDTNRARLETHQLSWVDWCLFAVCVVKALVMAGILAANTLKAFLDQHLTHAKTEHDTENKPPPSPSAA